MEEEFKKLELDDKWQEHFEALLKKSRRHSFEASDNANNKQLNRYLDVVPYDRSRVKLKRTKHNDYINANLVTVPKAARQYILTQGPLPETLGHFWAMVWEQNSHVIIMLNRTVEPLIDNNAVVTDEGFVKCERYWPQSEGDTDQYEDVNLAVTLDKVELVWDYIVRTITLEDQSTSLKRIVKQFQYRAWPDHDQPASPMLFLKFLADIRKTGCLDKMDEPTIVHCSAGIGRSGTFCLIDSVLCMIENQGSTEGIDIASTLLEMRDYRMGLIQSPVQLRFAYMTIIYGVKILENANKLHPHISSTIDNNRHQQQQRLQQQSNQNEQDSAPKINGSSNKKAAKQRPQIRKRNSNTSSNLTNIFNKQQLVEAIDAIGGDAADKLFEDAMKTCQSLKKARNSSPDDDANVELLKQICNQSMNSISTNNLLRRRERELRIAEKTMEIKNRMKAEELKRERMGKLRKIALIGSIAAVALSSVVYIYLS